MTTIICCLGNPGDEYVKTRHNIGFRIGEYLANHFSFEKLKKKFNAKRFEGVISGQKVMIIEPQTYMNNSGVAVKEFKDFFNVNNDKIYVIHDEIDLDQGRVKIKVGGGHNGHNGIKSLDQFIGKDYNRVRVGVSRPSRIYENNVDENISSWVLSNFSSDERIKWVDDTINKVAKNIYSLIKDKNIF